MYNRPSGKAVRASLAAMTSKADALTDTETGLLRDRVTAAVADTSAGRAACCLEARHPRWDVCSVLGGLDPLGGDHDSPCSTHASTGRRRLSLVATHGPAGFARVRLPAAAAVRLTMSVNENPTSCAWRR